MGLIQTVWMSSSSTAESTTNHVPLWASQVGMWALPAWQGSRDVSTQALNGQGRGPHLAVVSPGEPSRAAPALLGNGQCSRESLPQLKILLYMLLTSEVQLNFAQKLASHSRKLLLSLKRTRRMLITFVFREMLIWNAQRVTLSITISAYIDYISA